MSIENDQIAPKVRFSNINIGGRERATRKHEKFRSYLENKHGNTGKDVEWTRKRRRKSASERERQRIEIG